MRRERWWLASISAVALAGVVGAGVLIRPGTGPFQIEYLMTIAGLLWFLGLAAGLTGQAWRRTGQTLV